MLSARTEQWPQKPRQLATAPRDVLWAAPPRERAYHLAELCDGPAGQRAFSHLPATAKEQCGRRFRLRPPQGWDGVGGTYRSGRRAGLGSQG